MNKGIIKAAAAILFCVALAACGGGQAAETPVEENDGGDVFSNIPETVACVVRISVNPEFELHVTDDGVIENVIPLNDEAKSVCEALDITGKSYEKGALELLEAVYNQGYISGDSRVSISTLRRSGAQFDIPFVTDKIVSEFVAGVADAPFDVQNETAEGEEQAQQPSAEDDKADRPVSITDENGNEVRYEYYENGSYASIEVIRPSGSSQKTLFGEDGAIIEEHIRDGSDYGIVLYENGVMVAEEIRHGDGSIDSNTYDENGVKVAGSRTEPNGTKTEFYYDSGVPVSGVTYYTDGSRGEITYRNGVIYSENIYGLAPEGHTIRNTFHPNGRIAETVDYYAHNGQEMIYRYDECGTLSETYGYDNYGRRIHTVYNPDGSSVSVRTNEDGSTTVLG